jgi:hypothetical protein
MRVHKPRKEDAMKRSRATTAALALACTLAALPAAGEVISNSGGGAATGNNNTNQINSPMGISNTLISGTVQAVDSPGNTVEIRDTAGAVHRVTLDNHTQVSRNGSNVSPGDIHPGDAVVVRTNNAAM